MSFDANRAQNTAPVRSTGGEIDKEKDIMDELNAAEAILGVEAGMAQLVIYLGGELGESPDLIPYDSPDADVKRWATEAVEGGSIPGIDQQDIDFSDYVVARVPAKGGHPDRVMVRPKTEVGGRVIMVKCKVAAVNTSGEASPIRCIDVNSSHENPEGPSAVVLTLGDKTATFRARDLVEAITSAAGWNRPDKD